MKKITLIAIIFAVMLIGVIFVSAAFLQEEKTEANKGDCQLPQLECNSETCNQQCGGNCGIPGCGCR